MTSPSFAITGLALALIAGRAAASVGECPSEHDELRQLHSKSPRLSISTVTAPIVITKTPDSMKILWVDHRRNLQHIFVLRTTDKLQSDSIDILIGNDGENNPIFCALYASASNGVPSSQFLDDDGSIRIDKLGFTGAVTATFDVSSSSLRGWSFPHPQGDPTNGYRAISIKWWKPGTPATDPPDGHYPPSFANLMPPTLSNYATTLTIKMSNISGLRYNYHIKLADPRGIQHRTDPKIVNQ